MTALAGITVRPARESDMAYVYDTWLKALRPEYPDMRTGDYFEWMRERIDDALRYGLTLAEDVHVVVLYPGDEEDVIWAWAAFDWRTSDRAPAVLFVYVRPDHRKQGLGRAIIESECEPPWPQLTVRHLTADARAIKRTHPNLLRYIPC